MTGSVNWSGESGMGLICPFSSHRGLEFLHGRSGIGSLWTRSLAVAVEISDLAFLRFRFNARSCHKRLIIVFSLLTGFGNLYRVLAYIHPIILTKHQTKGQRKETNSHSHQYPSTSQNPNLQSWWTAQRLDHE